MRPILYHVKRLFFITLGALLVATATNMVLVPNDLLAGGLTGIATFFFYLFQWNISFVVLLLNIPLFILGFILVDKGFMYSTLVGLIIFSICLKLTEGYTLDMSDSLSITMVAGILNGCGCGIIYRTSASLGGSDIIAKIVNHYFSINMATVALLINGVIILCSIALFGIDLAMLTLANMFISSKITNFVVDGINYKRTLCITTSSKHAMYIAEHIIRELHHHVTITEGIIACKKEPCSVLYTTVGISEVGKIKRLVKSHDSHAFISLTTSAIIIETEKNLTLIEH